MAKPQTENGYTKIANELLEHITSCNLTGYQLRVLFAILRKTYGYQKSKDIIALSQLSKITGLAKPHISRAIKELKTRLIVTTDGNKIGINKDYEQWIPLPPMVKAVTTDGNTVTTDGNKSLPPAAPQKKYKETITKEILTNVSTEFGNSDINEISKYFLQQIKIPREDCSTKQSRQYWHLLLKESKRGLEGVKWLVDQAAKDDFYRNNITSSKDLWYKRVKLIARARGKVPRIAIMGTEKKGNLFERRLDHEKTMEIDHRDGTLLPNRGREDVLLERTEQRRGVYSFGQ